MFRINDDASNILVALNKSNTTVEFDLDGKITAANAIFLESMGYSLDEILGQNHSLFVRERDAESSEYAEFWTAVKAGEMKAGEFPRVAKCGREVWFRGSYNPVFRRGKPYKIVKVVSDITAEKSHGTVLRIKSRPSIARKRRSNSIEMET